MIWMTKPLSKCKMCWSQIPWVFVIISVNQILFSLFWLCQLFFFHIYQNPSWQAQLFSFQPFNCMRNWEGKNDEFQQQKENRMSKKERERENFTKMYDNPKNCCQWQLPIFKIVLNSHPLSICMNWCTKCFLLLFDHSHSHSHWAQVYVYCITIICRHEIVKLKKREEEKHQKNSSTMRLLMSEAKYWKNLRFFFIN